MIEKLRKFWAASIAYLALLAGASLSVAGNVADTFRTRASLTDGLDIIMAGAWPILVLLTIELFVSQRWSPARGFQILRWFGCMAVGSTAMLVSWVHLHDLLSSRGQLMMVSLAGPLAIDGMAIMATGLLLSSRARAMASSASVHVSTPPASVTITMDNSAATFTPDADIVAEDLDEVDNVLRETSSMWERLSETLDASTTPAVPLTVVRGNEVKPESIPADAHILIAAWLLASEANRPKSGEMEAILAGEFGVAPRTIRRWRYAVAKA